MTEQNRRELNQPEPTVETVITAKDGLFTYRVIAYRALSTEECKKVVWRALQVDYIDEPEPGGEVTLVTKIGNRSTDESIDWLQQYIRSRSDLGSDALAAISRHAGDRSLNVLIGIVESDSDRELREEAVFWMVLSESDAAFEYIDRLLIKN